MIRIPDPEHPHSITDGLGVFCAAAAAYGWLLALAHAAAWWGGVA